MSKIIEDNTVTMKDFRTNLSEIFNLAAYKGERIRITKNGKVQAAIIDKDDLEIFEAMEMAADIKAYDKAKKNDGGGYVSFNDVVQDMGLEKEVGLLDEKISGKNK